MKQSARSRSSTRERVLAGVLQRGIAERGRPTSSVREVALEHGKKPCWSRRAITASGVRTIAMSGQLRTPGQVEVLSGHQIVGESAEVLEGARRMARLPLPAAGRKRNRAMAGGGAYESGEGAGMALSDQ